MHTVLVVDDEPASLRAAYRSLSGEHRVLSAERASRALELMQAETVAVVVSDQRMPDMTGTELLAHCAQRYPDALRILLTGYTDLDTLQAAINAGHVFSYVAKPWEPRDLRLAVGHAVERYDLEADRRRLIGALQDSCQQLRREAETKTRLLALTAHELGTPLHLISASLAVLGSSSTERPETPPADQGEAIAVARRAVDWMARVLEQIHVFGRIEDGLALTRELLAPAALIGAVVAAHQPAARSRGIELLSEIAPVPAVAVDGVWIKRALACLLSNAIRFTPDGGAIRVVASVQCDELIIAVNDSGIGVPPALVAELFEPFSSATGDVDAHTSGQFEFGARGLGLGLATAYRIAIEHGGTIRFDSCPGGGSRFALYLPLGREPAKAEDAG